MGFIKDDNVALELDSVGPSTLGVNDVVVGGEDHIGSAFEVTSGIVGANPERKWDKK